jgi:hypothetical protein
MEDEGRKMKNNLRIRQIQYFNILNRAFVYYMCNEQTNARLIDSLLYCSLSFLHVSTPTRHPQGALVRCLLSYINALMQSCWCFVRNFHIRLFRIVKTLKLS